MPGGLGTSEVGTDHDHRVPHRLRIHDRHHRIDHVDPRKIGKRPLSTQGEDQVVGLRQEGGTFGYVRPDAYINAGGFDGAVQIVEIAA